MARKNSTKEIFEIISEATDTILKGIDIMFSELKDDFANKFKKVDERFDKLEAEVAFIKKDIKNLSADLSTTPTRKEFQELKSKFERHHSTS